MSPTRFGQPPATRATVSGSDGDRGAAGDVVDEDRQLGAARDGREVPGQALLRGLDERRGDDEHRVDARPLGDHAVRALVRDPERAKGLAEAGVELVAGDMGDRETIAAATEGVDAVFFHLPLVFERDTGRTYARNVLDAARRADVEVLVFNSGSVVPTHDTGHLHLDLKRDIEAYCAEVGLPVIVLRPRLY